MGRHAKTPGGTQLVRMEMPPYGTKRDLFSAAAQQSFDNARTKMTDLNHAIVEQQQTRTPDPRTYADEQDNARNFLNEAQRHALDLWCEQFKFSLIGRDVREVATQFNTDIASYHEAFFTAGHESKRITQSNLLHSLRKLGLSQGNSGRIVAVSADVFTPLAPAVAEAPALPPGVVAVTLYRGSDGKLYDTLEDAADASRVDEFAQFIYENEDGHDEDSAKVLAGRIFRVYNISRK